MTNKIGTIEYRRLREQRGDEKMILISCPCQNCHKIAIRGIDCPEHLQDAQPGMIVYIDRDGRLQAMEDP